MTNNNIDHNPPTIQDSLEHEFCLLEKLSEQQSERYRPYIDTIDRYKDYRPYFENKVTLLGGAEMSASIIDFAHSKEKYQNFIATQAPYKHNVSLFWQMIIEKHIEQIVMLTELVENADFYTELAYPYWPQEINETITLENDIEITLIEEKELLSDLKELIQIRKFNLYYQGSNKIVIHYWYRNWMDNTAPSEIQTILTLINSIDEYKHSNENSPILVHCSAGVGRTGVFITLYHLMQRIKYKDQKIKLFDLISYLRLKRPYFVLMLSQYKFCYQMSNLFLQNSTVDK